MIYFDNASTTSVRPEVARVYKKLIDECFANADSMHAPGRKTNRQLEQAREHIAHSLKVAKEEILFTSCASESNSLAIVGYALANQHRGKHILTSNVEHSSTKHAMDFLESIGFDVERLPINEQGIVTEEMVQSHMRKDTMLVSLMHVNNEIGSINPIEKIAKVVHMHPTCVFHSDCVQSFGKIDIPFEQLDMMTMSAHKIHGIKGSSMLMKKKNIVLQPLVFGGQQEQGLRGGTENAPANIVLAKTIRLALEEQKESYAHVKALRDHLAARISAIDGGHVLSPQDALPYILNVSFDQITSEVLLNALDEKGICVSAKSTCDSRSSQASEVILALNHSQKDASHAIRLSFSKDNTIEEADRFIEAVKEIIKNYGLSL